MRLYWIRKSFSILAMLVFVVSGQARSSTGDESRALVPAVGAGSCGSLGQLAAGKANQRAIQRREANQRRAKEVAADLFDQIASAEDLSSTASTNAIAKISDTLRLTLPSEILSSEKRLSQLQGSAEGGAKQFANLILNLKLDLDAARDSNTVAGKARALIKRLPVVGKHLVRQIDRQQTPSEALKDLEAKVNEQVADLDHAIIDYRKAIRDARTLALKLGEDADSIRDLREEMEAGLDQFDPATPEYLVAQDMIDELLTIEEQRRSTQADRNDDALRSRAILNLIVKTRSELNTAARSHLLVLHSNASAAAGISLAKAASEMAEGLKTAAGKSSVALANGLEQLNESSDRRQKEGIRAKDAKTAHQTVLNVLQQQATQARSTASERKAQVERLIKENERLDDLLLEGPGAIRSPVPLLPGAPSEEPLGTWEQ